MQLFLFVGVKIINVAQSRDLTRFFNFRKVDVITDVIIIFHVIKLKVCKNFISFIEIDLCWKPIAK